jgi:D-serine deaminase-like pyridoxal phosphate-dependent protein
MMQTRYPFHVWLKVDCGYHRAGVDPTGELAVDLARAVHESPTLSFDGILSHSGHAYRIRGPKRCGRSRRRMPAA